MAFKEYARDRDDTRVSNDARAKERRVNGARDRDMEWRRNGVGKGKGKGSKGDGRWRSWMVKANAEA